MTIKIIILVFVVLIAVIIDFITLQDYVTF